MRLIVGDEDITSNEYDPADCFQQGRFSSLILNIPALESAVEVPHTEFYKGLFVKAAALYRSLNLNHPFVDGNKRTATIALMIFLMENGYYLDASMEEIVNYTLDIAKGKHRNLNSIARWIKRHCHSVTLEDEKRSGSLVALYKAIKRLWDLYIR